jgi:molybdopterin molybdotransferase
MLTRLGVDMIDIGVVRDDPDALETTLREAASVADAVITSGGVSVGDADFTRDMMARLGEVLFWKIAMKPGRPMAFGRIGARALAWLFGLPGNPVAVMVSFYQFARRRCCAWPASIRCRPAPAAGALRHPPQGPGRTEFIRGVLFRGGGWQVKSTGAQGSGILSSMADANCFIVLGPAQTSVAEGTGGSPALRRWFKFLHKPKLTVERPLAFLVQNFKPWTAKPPDQPPADHG